MAFDWVTRFCDQCFDWIRQACSPERVTGLARIFVEAGDWIYW